MSHSNKNECDGFWQLYVLFELLSHIVCRIPSHFFLRIIGIFIFKKYFLSYADVSGTKYSDRNCITPWIELKIPYKKNSMTFSNQFHNVSFVFALSYSIPKAFFQWWRLKSEASFYIDKSFLLTELKKNTQPYTYSGSYFSILKCLPLHNAHRNAFHSMIFTLIIGFWCKHMRWKIDIFFCQPFDMMFLVIKTNLLCFRSAASLFHDEKLIT